MKWTWLELKSFNYQIFDDLLEDLTKERNLYPPNSKAFKAFNKYLNKIKLSIIGTEKIIK